MASLSSDNSYSDYSFTDLAGFFDMGIVRAVTWSEYGRDFTDRFTKGMDKIEAPNPFFRKNLDYTISSSGSSGISTYVAMIEKSTAYDTYCDVLEVNMLEKYLHAERSGPWDVLNKNNTHHNLTNKDLFELGLITSTPSVDKLHIPHSCHYRYNTHICTEDINFVLDGGLFLDSRNADNYLSYRYVRHCYDTNVIESCVMINLNDLA